MAVSRVAPVLLILSLGLTAGCSAQFLWQQDPILFNGIEFRSKSAPRDKKNNRKLFEVTVRPVSASMDGARAAGEHQGTVYCITNFGKSDIKWEIGPYDEVVPIEKDTLTLQGRCDP